MRIFDPRNYLAHLGLTGGSLAFGVALKPAGSSSGLRATPGAWDSPEAFPCSQLSSKSALKSDHHLAWPSRYRAVYDYKVFSRLLNAVL